MKLKNLNSDCFIYIISYLDNKSIHALLQTNSKMHKKTLECLEPIIRQKLKINYPELYDCLNRSSEPLSSKRWLYEYSLEVEQRRNLRVLNEDLLLLKKKETEQSEVDRRALAKMRGFSDELAATTVAVALFTGQLPTAILNAAYKIAEIILIRQAKK